MQWKKTLGQSLVQLYILSNCNDIVLQFYSCSLYSVNVSIPQKCNYSDISINMRSMGHIAQLRKQFISFNTYDYIKKFIKRRKKIL